MHRYEAMHMIRKGQVRWLAKGDVLSQRAFNPSGFRFGPRCQLGKPPTNSLGALAPRRGRISMMIGTASSELVQPLGLHPGLDRPTCGFMHFVSLGPYFTRITR
jgi:hypothetical protein